MARGLAEVLGQWSAARTTENGERGRKVVCYVRGDESRDVRMSLVTGDVSSPSGSGWMAATCSTLKPRDGTWAAEEAREKTDCEHVRHMPLFVSRNGEFLRIPAQQRAFTMPDFVSSRF